MQSRKSCEPEQCPRCLSVQTVVYVDDRTDQHVTLRGMQLLRCMRCANVFAAPQNSKAISASSCHAPCANCGYDLTAHRAGGRCPECGALIPVAEIRLNHKAISRSRGWRWGWPLFGVTWAAFLILCWLVPGVARVDLALAIIGFGGIGYGLKGIVAQSLSPNIKTGSPLLFGWKAVVWGTWYLLVGLAFLVCGIAMFFGVL